MKEEIMRVLLAAGLVGVTCFTTHTCLKSDYSVELSKLHHAMMGYAVRAEQDRNSILTELGKRSREAALLQTQVELYQDSLESLSRPGIRNPLGEFVVSAYDPDVSCVPYNDGITATGLPAGMGVVAIFHPS